MDWLLSLAPTAGLGVLLGWLAWRSSSDRRYGPRPLVAQPLCRKPVLVKVESRPLGVHGFPPPPGRVVRWEYSAPCARLRHHPGHCDPGAPSWTARPEPCVPTMDLLETTWGPDGPPVRERGG